MCHGVRSKLLKITLQKQCFFPLSIALAVLLGSTSAFAVTTYKEHENKFVTDLNVLRASQNLDFDEETVELKLPISKIKKRLKKAKKDKRVEPLDVIITPKAKNIQIMAKKLARKNKLPQTIKLIDEKLSKAPNHYKHKNKKVITFHKNDFKTISPKKFSSYFKRKHFKVSVQSESLASDAEKQTEFFRQLAPFISSTQQEKINQKILTGQPISVDEYLLPSFAKRMVQKFTIFRGPNCFHAALAFASPSIPKAQTLNTTEERNYHRIMINYDELWRILNTYFYEVNTEKNPMQYGDILVFFDFEKNQPISYKWIKHTAVYLFGPYTFSKGSKSANTPYSVKTLGLEWATWQKYTKNTGVKVFRTMQKNAKKTPPIDLIDWMY